MTGDEPGRTQVSRRRLLAGAAACAVLAAGCGGRRRRAAREPEHPLTGKPAPELKLEPLDGAPTTLARLRGREPLALAVVYTGEAISQQLLAELDRWTRGRPDAPKVVAVSVEARDALRGFAAKHRPGYTLARVPDAAALKPLEIEWYPYLLLIGREGKLVKVLEGYSAPYFAKTIAPALEQLRAGAAAGGAAARVGGGGNGK